MAHVRRSVAGLAVVSAALTAVIACDSGDGDERAVDEAVRQRVLQEDDLSPVEGRQWIAERPDSGPCQPIDAAEDDLFEGVSDDEWGLVRYDLEGGETVLSGVADHGDARYAQQRMDFLAFAAAECDDLDNDRQSYTLLTALPNGAVGYRSQLDTADGVVTIDRAAAAVGQWVFLVGAQKKGEVPETDIAELVDVALQRAAG